ncbi:MAG: hypothetical protein IJD96_02205, partial [Lachnospiraceae bacterium]|nr:hypothetical protein [Lachnospiraceae bacterium]
MDTKWKNSRKKRINITIITLVILAVLNVCLCPLVYRQIMRAVGEQTYTQEVNEAVYENTTSRLYQGCYVLYYEYMKSIGETEGTIEDFYFPSLVGMNTDEAYGVEFEIEYWASRFEDSRREYDYYAIGDKQPLTNTTMPLGTIFKSPVNEEDFNRVAEHYQYYLTLSFDELGN